MKTSLAYLTAALIAATAATASADEVRVQPSVQPAGRVEFRHRPGPRVMLPLTFDIGYVGTDTMLGYANGIGGSLGIHWSSLAPHPVSTDVGVGVFGALLSAPVASADAMTGGATGLEYGGAYLQVGHTLTESRFARTWLSARAEYLESSAFNGPNHTGIGGSVRLTGELYTSGVGIAPGQVFLGTYAIGLYAEAGVRQMVDGVSDFQTSVGITVRTPTVFSIF
jgi:hypothetical protein